MLVSAVFSKGSLLLLVPVIADEDDASGGEDDLPARDERMDWRKAEILTDAGGWLNAVVEDTFKWMTRLVLC